MKNFVPQACHLKKLIPYFPSVLPGKRTLGIKAKNDFTGFQILHQSQFIRILKFRSIMTVGGGGGGGERRGRGGVGRKKTNYKISKQEV